MTPVNVLKSISPIQCALSILLIAATVAPMSAKAASNDPRYLDPSFLIQVNDITDVTNQVVSTQCGPFSDEDDIGAWGEVVAQQIANGSVPNLSAGPADLIAVCPKYASMPQEKKENLWVTIMSLMSHYESSCARAVKAKGPNGSAGGLLQLHVGDEAAYSSACRRGDATKPDRALICGLSMLNDQVGKDGLLFSNSSYWAVMRPNNAVRKAARIKSSISQFAGCR